MVAQQILVLFVEVRILLGQRFMRIWCKGCTSSVQDEGVVRFNDPAQHRVIVEVQLLRILPENKNILRLNLSNLHSYYRRFV